MYLEAVTYEDSCVELTPEVVRTCRYYVQTYEDSHVELTPEVVRTCRYYVYIFVFFLIMAVYFLLPFMMSFHEFCDRIYAVCCGYVQVHVQVNVQCACVCAFAGVVTLHSSVFIYDCTRVQFAVGMCMVKCRCTSRCMCPGRCWCTSIAALVQVFICDYYRRHSLFLSTLVFESYKL